MASNSVPMALGVFLVLLSFMGTTNMQGETKKSTYKPFVLNYYVHIQIGGINANPNFLPALNQSFSANFGSGVLFALNVTEAINVTSKQLGYSRGYTIETSYLTGVARGLETVVIEYNDGTGKHNGTFVITGLVGTSGTNEVAIVGGTGTFRGANGYALISFVRVAPNNVYTFYHDSHFL